MNTVVTVTAKNQITLPSAIVSLLGLNMGNKLWTKVEDNTVVLKKIEDTWDDLHGFLSDNPIAKKYSSDQVYKMAQKIEVKRLMKK